MPKRKGLPTEAEIARYEMLEMFLNSTFIQIKEFAKRKPAEGLNQIKIASLNRILSPIKELMKSEPSHPFLDLLDEDPIPTYSDAVVTLAQFQAAMEYFKSIYFGSTSVIGSPSWLTYENPGYKYKDVL
jgi:hypothetical protein